ncbi:NTF2-like protein [Mytilinidion resinicola]|uniref:NTF2-like protein n=1 Tax=Mytilinidion resinicola TaxID=574789 RepID=A0A6A6YFI5_9PEZI|nr:NTF2-like protein [Mytilinidion resinicola]KAF2807586.1 NTF2-like protein [Mytilinidion resinicola]
MSLSNGNATQNGTTGFLSFNAKPPLVWITGDEEEFDETTLRYWKEEGFTTKYLPYSPTADPNAYLAKLKTLHNELPLGVSYALIAYGTAASLVLRAALKPMPRLCALVAYYPSAVPNPRASYPSQLQLVVHLAGRQVVPPTEFKSYRYSRTAPGFAEHAKPEFEGVEAGLAWGRTLGCVQKGFKLDSRTQVENTWDRMKFTTELYDDEYGSEMVNMMVPENPHVTHGPTLTGGIGAQDLEVFYRDYFDPSITPDSKIRLVSRTIGVDRVVDEMVVSFTHTNEVDWILPDVPPTNKKVEIAMVSIVGVRGGKLTHEHVYWDQASVLLQVGLLDPENVPEDLKEEGLKRLPVAGAWQARQILDPQKSRYNAFLPLI